MSVLDLQRATAIISRAQEHNMYEQGKMPESESDRIMAAEHLVQLARQAEVIKDQIGAHNMPGWPAAEAILFEAHVTMGSGDSNGHAATVEEGESDVKDAQDSSASADVHVDQPQQEASAEVTTTPKATREDPQKGEVWSDAQGGEWEILSYSGGVQAEVMKVSTGEKTLVPAGMLKRKVSGFAQRDEPDVKVIDNFSGPYEFLSNFSSSPITIDGIDYPTVEHAFQAHKSLRPEVRQAVANDSTPGLAKQHGRSLELRPDWEDVKVDVMRSCLAQKFVQGSELAHRLLDTGDAELIEGNNWGDDYWGIPYGGVGLNVLGSLLQERRFELKDLQTRPITHDDILTPASRYTETVGELRERISTSDSSIPEHDDEGDERYQTILEETEERYSPAGMPIPQDLEDPPDGMPEMLDDVPDKVAQRLHGQYNSLAARAKFLHDVEDARARGCKLTRKLYMRGAMRKAREDLGASSTITEREAWAEDFDDDVRVWGERANKHEEAAKAWKTFFDIYTQNVVVLSRDWTMRDRQEKN